MMPMRIFANRSRAGSYVIMLILGAALFGMFYYLTFFIQGVLGLSSLKSGVAYLPFSLIIIIGSGIVSQVLPRVGPRLLLIAGSAFMTAGMFWYAQVHADTRYWSGIFPAMIVTATGVALVFVTLTVVAVTKVSDTDTGLASALLNVGQQIGGSIGLAVLATAVSSATKSEGTSQLAKLTGAAHQHLSDLLASSQTGKPAAAAAYADHPALHAVHVVQAHGSSHGFLVAAALGIVAVIAAIGLINVKKTDVPQASELALAA
jgi:predicted MFS family arabinose efflux permease